MNGRRRVSWRFSAVYTILSYADFIPDWVLLSDCVEPGFSPMLLQEKMRFPLTFPPMHKLHWYRQDRQPLQLTKVLGVA